MIVNGRFLNHRITGVERYAHEITRRLPVNTRIISPNRRLSGLEGHLWEQVVLPKLAGKTVLWSPANTGPVFANRHVVTIHDAFPLDHPEWYPSEFARWYQMLLPGLVQHAKKVVTVSEYSQKRLMKIFGLPAIKVVVAPGGVNRKMFFPMTEDKKAHFRSSWNLPEKYLLFLGTAEPRKNLKRLLIAWDLVRAQFPDVELILVGNGVPSTISLTTTVGRQVRSLGYLDDSCLPFLYSSAAAFVLPSLDEGFGLTILEAMACGTPVVAAYAGAIPEVAGDSAVYIDPFQPEDIAKGIELVLTSHKLRQVQIEKGLLRIQRYPWEKPAAVMLDLFREVSS